jgi:hypothetical protein
MKMTFDPEADAMSKQFSQDKANRKVQPREGIDLRWGPEELGRIVGNEILLASSQLGPKAIADLSHLNLKD